mgnify:CR=1 FL=1
MTPSQWYANTLPIRVVRMRGRSDWLPREQTFCSYVKRFQIMRANCRLSEDLCKGIDESLYDGCTNLLVLENDSIEEDQDNDIEGTRSATAL